MSGPQSIKEYWADPKHNRRKSAGRRESDYAVCPYHDGKVEQDEKDKEHLCANIKATKAEHEADLTAIKKEGKEDIMRVHARLDSVEDKIVGKWAFGVMVSIFLAMFTLFGALNYHLFNVIKSDLAMHIEMVKKGE